jgi:hypothetical protein
MWYLSYLSAAARGPALHSATTWLPKSMLAWMRCGSNGPALTSFAKSETIPPVILWIGVKPKSLTGEGANNAAFSLGKICQATLVHIF